MSVDVHGIEAIKLASEWTNPPSKADAYIKVSPVPKGFDLHPDTDSFTVELANGGLNVVYKFFSGGPSGNLLSTVTLTYSTPQTLDLTAGEIARSV